ncbi:MAG: chemotaxis protein CheA [Aquificaceae bacterium]|nr:chemotaxis protein CheA [Aquificaceae bacterium]
MIPEDMREIFEEFAVEAKEHLDNLERVLLELEREPENKDLINSAFRSMHTIKGGAGFLGLSAIVEVAHKAEDVLGKLRSGELHFSSFINDAILRSIDFIRHAIGQYAKEEAVSVDVELLEDLESLLRGEGKTEVKEELYLEELLIKHGLSHLVGKPIEEILEELVLLPPDKRPQEIVDAIDRLVSKAGTAPNISEEIEEEANKLMLDYAEERLLDEVVEAVVEEVVMEEAKKSEGVKTKQEEKRETRKEEEVERILRIDVQKIENLMNLVGELVLERNRLLRTLQSLSEEYQSKSVEEMETVISSLDRIVGDLQLAVMKTRMQPVKKLFQKFPRVVRDLSRLLGKDVQLVMEGEDTEMDKSLIEKLEEPLIHLLRNSVDHGIEPGDERERLGKPRTGTVKLKAYYQGDRVFLSIEDDGRGIDVQKVKEKAIQKGIITPERADKMTEKEILSLIFSPGFSTADRISEVSGRGVGMDVVMNTVINFRGTVDVWSEKGKGTKVVMSFPLTVGIIKSLLVSIGGRLFSIPIYSVLEIVSGDDAMTSFVSGEEVLILRESTIPLISLGEILSIPMQKIGYIVVCLIGNRRVALAVEDMLGDEEVVIKPLGKLFGDIEGISGATITGDGSIVLILDPVGLIKRTVGMF